MKKGLEWQGSISDKTPEIISVSNVLRGLDSSEIVANINAGNIKLSVIGDELFERAFGVASDVTGLAIDNKIYIRKSSITIHSDMVHEGTHALDYLRGISYSERAGWAGEIRAYTAEHHFQKAANITLEFAN